MSGALSPNQQRILDEVFSFSTPRPSYEPDLVQRLGWGLDDVVVAAPDPGKRVVVGKYHLGWVHRCEGRYWAGRTEPFEWTVAMIRGRVAHRAIEAAFVLGGSAAPLDLVEKAVDALMAGEEQESLVYFLRELPDLDMARLKAEANDAVVAFLSDWPPIDRRWTPRVESRVAVSLAGGRVRLQAKYDMAFGRPAGTEARVIVVDFKTGSPRPQDPEDLRFYALVDTLRNGVPPFRVASYYLEEGRVAVETIGEDALRSAARRTADGLRAILEIEAGREPALTPGPACKWCPARHACEPGKTWLAARADAETEGAGIDD